MLFVCVQKILNDALMGILRVRNLISPPYISTIPTVNVHRISKSDRFVVLGSDGLFDFFTNEEVVRLVHLFISKYPSGDPAKFLLEQLVIRAADSAGMFCLVNFKRACGRLGSGEVQRNNRRPVISCLFLITLC